MTTPTRILRRPTGDCPNGCATESDIWRARCQPCGRVKPLVVPDQVVLLSRLLLTASETTLNTLDEVWQIRLSHLLETVTCTHHARFTESVHAMLRTKCLVTSAHADTSRVLHVGKQLVLAVRTSDRVVSLKWSIVLNQPDLVTWTHHMLLNKCDLTPVWQEHLKCPVCLETVTDCVLTACAHWFCRRCYEQSQTTQTVCPMCRSDTFAISADRLLAPMREQLIAAQHERHVLARVLLDYLNMCTTPAKLLSAVEEAAESMPTIWVQCVQMALERGNLQTLALARDWAQRRVPLDECFLLLQEQLCSTKKAINKDLAKECCRFFDAEDRRHGVIQTLIRKHNELVLLRMRGSTS